MSASTSTFDIHKRGGGRGRQRDERCEHLPSILMGDDDTFSPKYYREYSGKYGKEEYFLYSWIIEREREIFFFVQTEFRNHFRNFFFLSVMDSSNIDLSIGLNLSSLFLTAAAVGENNMLTQEIKVGKM